MRLKPAQGARQRRHPQGSPAGIEPQIAHPYACASVKIDLLWKHAELGTYAQRCVITIKVSTTCQVHQFILDELEETGKIGALADGPFQLRQNPQRVLNGSALDAALMRVTLLLTVERQRSGADRGGEGRLISEPSNSACARGLIFSA